MDFKDKYEYFLNKINYCLNEYMNRSLSFNSKIFESMKYSLMAGGKRVRPVLALAVCDMFENDLDIIMSYACAVEMIHTYSLIHDDLPCMDNDDLRRGKPTNHKVFGEAMAILAGDGLLNYAFEIMIQDSLSENGNILNKVKAMGILAECSGVFGMVGGQFIDMSSQNKEIEFETLNLMHMYKTGALIKAPILMSGVLCNAAPQELESLQTFSEKIGLAFQVRDDILDVEGISNNLGKSIGKDKESNKVTFVKLYGLEEAKKIVNILTKEAENTLMIFGERAKFLQNFARMLEMREN